MEVGREMIRGHDRAAYGGGNGCAAKDHKTAGSKNDRATVDTGNENRTGVESEQAVSRRLSE